MRRYTRRTLMREVLLILVAIIWMIPFYFLVIVAVKPDIEALQTPLSFPDELHLANFSTAWNDASLDRCQRLVGDMTLAADSIFSGGSSTAARISSIGVAAIDAGIALTGTLWNADRYPHPDERCDPGSAP